MLNRQLTSSLNCFKTFILLASGVLFFASCKDFGAFDRPYRVLETGPGPEDIALDTGRFGPRIIISCAERRTKDTTANGFYAYTMRNGVHDRLSVIGLPPNIGLHPHGIDVDYRASETLLYVVNHENERNRHGILVFRLDSNSVTFLDTLFHPLLLSPNDVCTDYKGGLYVSNDSGKRNGKWEKLWSLKRSYILHYDGNTWHQVGDKLAYANGVGVLGNRLYVTGTQEKAVHSYGIEGKSLVDRKDIPAIKGADNITFYNGKLVTAAHLDFVKFIGHAGKSTKKSPCMVYQIDLETQQLDTLFMDNGPVISAASTGLIYGDSLYVAQVFDPFILSIKVVDSK